MGKRCLILFYDCCGGARCDLSLSLLQFPKEVQVKKSKVHDKKKAKVGKQVTKRSFLEASHKKSSLTKKNEIET